MKLKELEELFNNSLASLGGKTFKSWTEFHDMKNVALSEIALDFGFHIKYWEIALDVCNYTEFQRKKTIFKIHLNSEDKKLFNFSLGYIINSVKVELCDDLRMYANLDIKEFYDICFREALQESILEKEYEISRRFRQVETYQKLLSRQKKQYYDIEVPELSISL